MKHILDEVKNKVIEVAKGTGKSLEELKPCYFDDQYWKELI